MDQPFRVAVLISEDRLRVRVERVLEGATDLEVAQPDDERVSVEQLAERLRPHAFVLDDRDPIDAYL